MTSPKCKILISAGKFYSPKYALFSLESTALSLDPVLFVGGATGRARDESITLPVAKRTICIIQQSGPFDACRVRLLPASVPAEFRFSLLGFYLPGPLFREVGRLRRRFIEGGADAPKVLCLRTSRSGGSYLETLNDPVASTTSEHFQHTLQLGRLNINRPTVDDVSRNPEISVIVPTFNTPPAFLRELVASFEAQGVTEAELLLSDDGSTKGETISELQALSKCGVNVIRHDSNTGIAGATNRGIENARGQWIALLDHDDVLAPGALRVVMNSLRAFPEARFFYTDEIVTDEQLNPLGYHLKPAFDPVLLSCVNYINHLSLYRRDRLLSRGLLREGFNGSQDYELLLRYLEGVPEKDVIHIPYPAYCWRRTQSSYSAKFAHQSIDNARKALHGHYLRQYKSVPIDPALNADLHRPRLDLAIEHWPTVSVVIPSKDRFELISRIVEDLRNKTDYPKLQLVIVDNGSEDPRVLGFYDELRRTWPGVLVDIAPAPFNFARQVNRGIGLAEGDAILLLNNDVQVISPDWLREMVSCLSYPKAGIVGARLLYPDRTLQHAGVIVGFGKLAGHWFHGHAADSPGPWGRLHVRQSFTAVTGACMLISRACLDKVGLLDDIRFGVAYNDIDYCLRAQLEGFRTVWTPFATLLHEESASRGSDDLPEHRARFAREKAELMKLHNTDVFEDPASSPWFTKDRSDPGLVMLGSLPPSRTNNLKRRPV